MSTIMNIYPPILEAYLPPFNKATISPAYSETIKIPF
jgi:hypothetical protein